MATAAGYCVPVDAVTVERQERKSRFIGSLQFVESKAAAIDFFHTVRKAYPGANHHCTAFIIGNPSSPNDIGCSDDGEPSGCAGKPMLNVLYHDRIGNVAVVVTRYYGGIKLGTGGLVRAYAGVVKALLKQTVLADYVENILLSISFHYQHEGGVRHLINRNHGSLKDARYDKEVSFEVLLPAASAPIFLSQLGELTGGMVSVGESVELDLNGRTVVSE